LGFGEVPGSPFGLNTVSPIALAFSPSGGLLVTANQTPDTEVSSVSVFTVAADGTLTQMAGSPFSTGSDPGSVAFSPSGGLVAFPNPSTPDGGGNTVSVFAVSADDVLTEVPGSPFRTGSDPQSAAFSPNGALLATANYSAGSISVFSVGAGGALTQVPGSPFGVGSLPESIAFSPNGALLAIQSFNTKSVSVFSVGAAGALTKVSGSPFSVGSLAGAIAFSPTGALLAVAPSAASMAGVTPTNSVTMFSVGACGALTQVPGSPFPTGGMETTSIAFSPSGTLLATDNYGSYNISLFSVAASGALTQVLDSPFPSGFPATSLAFSPNSALLATTNTDYSGVSMFSTGSSPLCQARVRQLPLLDY
jgi:6-phosphogluconolactonase (cycloisomerase 2 family)